MTILAATGPFASIEQAASAESLVHWRDGDNTDDDACTESYAALDLSNLLRRLPGMERRQLQLQAGDQLPAAGDCIVLGNARSQPLVKALDAAPPANAHPDAFRIRARREKGRTIWVIAGASRTGTLYGASALLERLGVRFYGPADSETVLPRAAVSLPTRIDTTSAPAFDVRGFWAWEPRGDAAFFRWMAHRRLNLWTANERNVPMLRKLGFRLTGGGHTMQSEYLAPAQYFARHPEWYGLHDGKRSPVIRGENGDNFCTSNTPAVEQLAANLVASLKNGSLRDADVVEAWPLDGGRWCECDKCTALGSPTDRMLNLLGRLTATVNSARRRGELTRDVTLSGPAYLETREPSTRAAIAPAGSVVTFFPYHRCYFHALDDPACTEFNAPLAAAWNGWTRASSRPPLAVCEYWNVSWFQSLPLALPHVIARDLDAYTKAGVRSFMYMHVPTRNWGIWRLDHLVMSEALWSPGFNVDSIVADYTARAYPGSAREMTRYHAALERATSNIMAVVSTMGALGAPNEGGRLVNPDLELLPLSHLQAAPAGPDQPASWVEIRAAFRAARESLDGARSLASSPAERERLDDDASRFTYGERMFDLWDASLRLGSALRGDPNIDVRAALAEADSAAAALRAMRDIVQGAGLHADAANGLEASHVGPALEIFHQRMTSGRAGR